MLPRRRQILRAGEPVPLIPRYFDLLVLLIERRQTVVTRQDIFDAVWGDVFVSDGALTQAVRTLRRLLDDDPKAPRFIRTVSRHGYMFICAEVVVVDDDDPRAGVVAAAAAEQSQAGKGETRLEPLVDQLLGRTSERLSLEDRRDLAQRLHGLGTVRALEAITAAGDGAEALALMRDTRWDVPGSSAVPLLGVRHGPGAARLIVAWRTREALRLTGRRWAQAAGGAAVAGALAGVVGGLLLALAPGSPTPISVVPVLVALGAVAGFTGAAGIAAGMAAAEAVARSSRGIAIVVGGAAGGVGIGGLLGVLTRWTLISVFGVTLEVSGVIEGLVIGAAVAAGYVVGTVQTNGNIPAPRGALRWRAALTTAIAGGLAAAVLSLSGYRLVGGIVHQVAQAFQGSQVSLAPLGAWLAEPAFGPLTQLLVAVAEGALFGGGLAWGLTRRAARSRRGS